MDLYALVKFLHISSAILWIGSGAGLVILGIAAERAGDREAFGRIIGNVLYLAPRLFIPSSLGALIFGAGAAWLSWSFTDLWIVLGLVGFAATFVTGNFFLKPRADRIAAIVAEEGYNDRALALGRELLALVKFDYVMLFLVVADMVFKPTASDIGLLAVFAVVLAVAGAYFLRGAFGATSRPA